MRQMKREVTCTISMATESIPNSGKELTLIPQLRIAAIQNILVFSQYIATIYFAAKLLVLTSKNGLSVVAMIRAVMRTFGRFLAAVVLFGLILCAVEVWFRWERINQAPVASLNSTALKHVVRPSSTTWIEVAELVEVEMPVSLQESELLRTSEFGTRGRSITVPKPSVNFRIVCLGGDELFGLGQKESETITAHLQGLFKEANLEHVEFINAGCPSGGVLTNFLRLKHKLIALQPDLVLYCISTDDVLLDQGILGGATLDSQGRPAYATHPGSQEYQKDKLSRICEEFATADWLFGQVGPLVGLKESRSVPEKNELYSTTTDLKTFIGFKEFCDANHCQLMISIIPNAWTENPKTGVVQSRNPQSFERDLHKLFSEHQIQSTSIVHNPLTVFQINAEEQGLYEEQTGHLNANGNMIYARTIAKSMVDFFPEILHQPLETAPRMLPVAPDLPDSNANSSIPLTNQSPAGHSIIR